MKPLYLYLLTVIVLSSGCSKYGYVNLNYPQEPQVYLPDDIGSIAIVNRSLTKDQDRESSVMESLVTSEIGGSDRLASEESLKAVYDGLNQYQGLKIVFPQKIRIYGTGTRETPEVLKWERVEAICDSANADVLLVLETFDSNSDLLLSAAAEQVTNVLSGGPPRASIPNQVRMNVYSYWRLYDPKTQSIIDQYQQTSYLTFDTQGRIPPQDALPETAYRAGLDYTNRFKPSYYTVRRDLYKKGKGAAKQEFRSGYRRAEVANWQGAIEIWGDMVGRVKRKTAGRACLNIAVAHEVLGNTEEALKWAQKAYEDYGDKLGREYAKILLRRKRIEH